MTTADRPYLVTGGAGFIGANLIEALAAKYPDLQIVSVDNYSTGTKENEIAAKNVQYIEGDTREIAEIWEKNGLAEPSVIFHLGEYSRIVQSFEDRDKLWDFNVMGTMKVLEFAQKCGAKFIYAGSSSKFGNEGEDENLSPYAWVKAKNAELIKNWKEWYGGPEYVITYFYNVYGPRQIGEGKYATIIGIFEHQYKNGEALTVVEPGTQTRDFTYVGDIVGGIMICADKGDGDGYQLGAGSEKTILEVAEMFGGKITMIPARKGERVSGRADSTRARELGWKPEVRIEDYIAEIVKK
jgi:UDP-glucose 4-epimerase